MFWMVGSGFSRAERFRAEVERERLLYLSGSEVVKACAEEMVFRAGRKGLAPGKLQEKNR